MIYSLSLFSYIWTFKNWIQERTCPHPLDEVLDPQRGQLREAAQRSPELPVSLTSKKRKQERQKKSQPGSGRTPDKTSPAECQRAGCDRVRLFKVYSGFRLKNSLNEWKSTSSKALSTKESFPQNYHFFVVDFKTISPFLEIFSFTQTCRKQTVVVTMPGLYVVLHHQNKTWSVHVRLTPSDTAEVEQHKYKLGGRTTVCPCCYVCRARPDSLR